MITSRRAEAGRGSLCCNAYTDAADFEPYTEAYLDAHTAAMDTLTALFDSLSNAFAALNPADYLCAPDAANYKSCCTLYKLYCDTYPRAADAYSNAAHCALTTALTDQIQAAKDDLNVMRLEARISANNLAGADPAATKAKAAALKAKAAEDEAKGKVLEEKARIAETNAKVFLAKARSAEGTLEGEPMNKAESGSDGTPRVFDGCGASRASPTTPFAKPQGVPRDRTEAEQEERPIRTPQQQMTYPAGKTNAIRGEGDGGKEQLRNDGRDVPDAEALIARGIAKRESGDYVGAIHDFDKAIELEPTHPKAYLERSNAKRELKDERGAVQDLNTFRVMFDRLEEGLKAIDAAEAAYDSDDYVAAVRNYNKAISLLPSLTCA